MKTKKKRIPFQFYPPIQLIDKLRQEHNETGLSISSIIIGRLNKSYKQDEKQEMKNNE